VTALPPVSLRALLAQDAEALEAGYSEAADPYNWAGHRASGWAAANVATGVTADYGNLAVLDETGTLVGDVSFRRIPTGPATSSWCWAVGISLLSAHRGRGLGAAAQRELARYLFATTAAERIEADTDVDNVAEQRALERAGFTREGVRRSYQWRDGAWHDTTVYAVVRSDLPVAGEL
jgi:RimJ/RimL family protein N-acetyltransferase